MTETSGRPTSHFLEQAMKGGLVGYEARDDGGAVTLVGEAQSAEPGGPPSIEVPLEADLVASRLRSIGVGSSVHLLPSAGLAFRSPA